MGRCLHRPGGHAPPQGSAGGIKPAPTNKFCVPGQTGTAAPHRADVGRDALIPPGLPPPRTPRADMESAPTTGGGHRGQPGNYGLATPQTPVGDDSISARPASPQGPREVHAPPLQTMANVAVKRVGPHHPGRRRAGCPHPAGPPAGASTPVLNRRGAAGVNARPTEPGKHGGQAGPPHRRNPCRGRFHIGPACIAARSAGGACPSPTNHGERCGQKGWSSPSGQT